MCYRCNEDQKFVRVKKEVKKRSLDLWLQLQLGGVNNIDIRQEEIMGHAVVQWVFVSLQEIMIKNHCDNVMIIALLNAKKGIKWKKTRKSQ